jgi:bifunctional DNase/RNase
MEVEMKIRGLMMDPVTNMPIVLLKENDSETVLPIWVGIYEANAIALEIEKVATPRPMTHDLLRNLLVGLDATVLKVVVTELKDDTFYAVIWLDRGGEVVSIDSRPSDAIALALRMDCPIYVDAEVIKSSKQAASASEQVTSEDLRKYLENLGDDDLGNYKM